MWGRILTKIFALFGITLTTVACYGTPYDEYHNMPDEFAARGTVVDKEGNRLNNIKVTLGSSETFTVNGGFTISDMTGDIIEFWDIDGEDNGGEFERHGVLLMESNRYIDLGTIVLKRVDEEQTEE